MCIEASDCSLDAMDDLRISYFAKTNFRNQGTKFGIKQTDRLSHIHIIGKTGTGKSTLLETLIHQDIRAGRGCALIDPHGDLATRVVARVPSRRASDLVYVNLPDPAQPYGYNPLTHVSPERRSLVASGIMELFEKMWPQAWGQRMEHILRNSLLALLDFPQATFAEIPRLYHDKSFRREVVANCTNEQVREFWRAEFPKYTYRYQAEAIAPIQNKVGAFLADERLHRFFVTPERPLRFRQLMDEGKILIINLAKGEIGSDSAGLAGGLIVTAIALGAFSRASLPGEARRPFHVFVDEFQSFTTLSVANMTAELRKYGIGLVLAHQYLHQLQPDVRHAVLGNAGSLIAFRLGAEDAAYVAHELEPFTAEDLIRLPNYRIYLRLMIDGEPSRPFSGMTLPPG
jgi:Helicase HerA, central domain/TraM recognition site of TraD and TraG